MNTPYLELSEQIDFFFPAYFHKIKFHIFHNIYKCLTYPLRTFEYKNTCALCYNIQKKYKRGEIVVKKCVVLHGEVIDGFINKQIIPQ